MIENPEEVKRVVFCSGKVYYDLLEYKEENKKDDVALVRIEQFYPFPEVQIKEIKKKYKNAEKYWVQEEPANKIGRASCRERVYNSVAAVAMKENKEVADVCGEHCIVV